MKILGIGVDILKISRIKRIFNRFKKKFSYRILSKKELCAMQKKKNKVLFLAKRFSIKEAFSKSLGTGIKAKKVEFKKIEILNNKNGKPSVRLLAETKKFFKKKAKKIHISLSDEKKYIISFSIIEK